MGTDIRGQSRTSSCRALKAVVRSLVFILNTMGNLWHIKDSRGWKVFIETYQIYTFLKKNLTDIWKMDLGGGSGKERGLQEHQSGSIAGVHARDDGKSSQEWWLSWRRGWKEHVLEVQQAVLAEGLSVGWGRDQLNV